MRTGVELRTLESMREHLQNFKEAGGDPKNAKHFFNVIDEIHFNISLDQVPKVLKTYCYVYLL